MNYKQAQTVLRGYGYPIGEVTAALDGAYEQGSKRFSDGMLVTWDDKNGFQLHEEHAKTGR